MRPIINTIRPPRVDPTRNRFLDCYHCGLENNDGTIYMHMRCWNEVGNEERDAAAMALFSAIERQRE